MKDLLYTKIIPEQFQYNIISRQSLLNKLINNLDKTLIVVSAKAGYGKTTLIKEAMKSLNRKFAWYKIDNSDNELFTFFSYFVKSISLINESFGFKTFKIINALKSQGNYQKNLNNNINDIVTSILNELAQFNNYDIIIVLDDFHLVSDAIWVNKAFSFLLDNAPQNLHVIITTREKLPFETAKLKAKRKILELIDNDLKLNRKETQEIVSKIYKKILTDEEVNTLNRKFNGWVTGIHMFLQAPDNPSKKLMSKELPGTLFDYFREDIFNALSEKEKDFLLSTSLLDDFTIKQCNHILKIKNCNIFINDLLKKNIFLQETEINIDKKLEKSYKYDDTFKEFLLKKFNEDKTEKEKKQIYKAIADYYLFTKHSDKAIEYLMYSGNVKKAQQLLLENLSFLWVTMNYFTLLKLINMMPEEFQNENPYVLHYKLLLKSWQGYQFKDIEPGIMKILNAFKKLNDAKYYSFTLNILSNHLINIGKYNEAIKILKDSLKNQQFKKYHYVFHHALGIVYSHMNDTTRAYESVQKVLESLKKDKVGPNTEQSCNLNLSWISIIRGDMDMVLHYSQKVFDHSTFAHSKSYALYHLILAHCCLGNYEETKELITKDEELTKGFYTSPMRNATIQDNYCLLFSLGDYDGLIDFFNKTFKIIEDSEIGHTILSANLFILKALLLKKDFKAALENLTQYKAKKISLNRYLVLSYNLCEILAKIYLTNNKNLVNELISLYDYSKKNEMKVEISEIAFFIADYYLRNGNTKEAEKYLSESFKIAHKQKYFSFFERQIVFDRNLFDFAADKNMFSEFISQVYQKVKNKLDIKWLNPEYKAKLQDDLTELYDVQVKTLGNFEVKIRGKVIPDELWVRKKRKLTFIYIFLNRNNNLTKDKILDILFPDEIPDKFDNMFYQIITTIRNVFKFPFLKNENSNKKSTSIPNYLIYHDKHIELNSSYFYYSDVEEFEKLTSLAFEDGLALKDKFDHLKKAIDLYKGNFLEDQDENWIVSLREKYQTLYQKSLNEIIDISKSFDNYQDIIKYSEKLLELNNLKEELYLDIIKAELKLNNITNAKYWHRQMLRIFKTELKDTPSKEALSAIKDLFSSKVETLEAV